MGFQNVIVVYTLSFSQFRHLLRVTAGTEYKSWVLSQLKSLANPLVWRLITLVWL